MDWNLLCLGVELYNGGVNGCRGLIMSMYEKLFKIVKSLVLDVGFLGLWLLCILWWLSFEVCGCEDEW